MTAKPPPVPPANRSPKGTGDQKGPTHDETQHGKQTAPAPQDRGDQKNIKINTTHQGLQQDR